MYCCFVITGCTLNRKRKSYLEWENEAQAVEVLTLEGDPLLGNDLWKNYSLQAENTDGGDVGFEPL